MNGYILLFLILITNVSVNAQTISGKLTLLSEKKIRLEGFNGLKTYPISNTSSDKQGNFKLSYSTSDAGIGFLISEDEKPFFIILSGEDIEISGEALSYIETISINKGKENQYFERYAQEHPRREQALSAWNYLEKIYNSNDLFSKQKKSQQAIIKEKNRIINEDAAFLNGLAKESYVSWFLPIRKLISSVSVIAQYRTEEIPATISALRNINYADERLYKSGLLKDAIDNQIWLIENSSKPVDSVFHEMKISVDIMLEQLKKNDQKLNEITKYLFELLEKRSLFSVAEHLAIRLLGDASCTLNNDLSAQLESYRKMKVGNQAPDITFGEFTYFPEGVHAKKLSELTSPYYLVVFGASWCGHCTQEIPKMAERYPYWKQEGVEVVLVSLDESAIEFAGFVAAHPFISTSEYKKWESRAAKDYHVFATPTYFLLDNSLKILLKPASLEQIDAWIDLNIGKGNLRK